LDTDSGNRSLERYASWLVVVVNRTNGATRVHVGSIMSIPSISIIIVSFNTCNLLRNCLHSVERFLPESQVIVIDNASSDGSVAMVRSEFPDITLIESNTNLGFAGANNRGLLLATGEYLVLLNSDTLLEDDTLTRCAQWMRIRKNLGAVTPLLIGVDNKPQTCQFRFMSLTNEIRQMLWQDSYTLKGDDDSDCWLPGTALVIRQEALRDIGGALDDNFFMYGEDADLSMRLCRAGWFRAVFRDGYIRHYGGASGGGADIQRRSDLQAWYFHARYRWARKHWPFGAFVSLLCIDFLDIARGMITSLWNGNVLGRASYSKIKIASLIRAITGSPPPLPQRTECL